MKSEQDIRTWRRELRAQYATDHGLGALGVGLKAAIDAASWILGDTPESDLQRVKVVIAEKFGEDLGELWMLEPNNNLGGYKPLQLVTFGAADDVIAFLRHDDESPDAEPSLV